MQNIRHVGSAGSISETSTFTSSFSTSSSEEIPATLLADPGQERQDGQDLRSATARTPAQLRPPRAAEFPAVKLNISRPLVATLSERGEASLQRLRRDGLFQVGVKAKGDLVARLERLDAWQALEGVNKVVTLQDELVFNRTATCGGVLASVAACVQHYEPQTGSSAADMRERDNLFAGLVVALGDIARDQVRGTTGYSVRLLSALQGYYPQVQVDDWGL